MICEPDLPGIYFDDFNEFDTRNEQHSDLVPQSTSDRRTSMHQILPKNSYKCTVCNKLVKGSNQFLNHVRTHTGGVFIIIFHSLINIILNKLSAKEFCAKTSQLHPQYSLFSFHFRKFYSLPMQVLLKQFQRSFRFE